MSCIKMCAGRKLYSTAVNVPRSCTALVYSEYGDPSKVVRYKNTQNLANSVRGRL